jgi:malonyl-CoA O-methyltransferase
MNKDAIAAGFSRAAPTYDDFAEAQRRMAERLAAMLPSAAELGAPMAASAAFAPAKSFKSLGSLRSFEPSGPGAEPIVELGCGTGLLTEMLLARYPGVPLRGVDLAPGMIEHCRRRFAGAPGVAFEVADAEHWRPAGPAALVVSNCTFQWLHDPQAALAAIRGYLAPGGRLAVGAMLAGSLAELDASHRAATGGAPMPSLDLWDAERWMAALAEAGLRPLEPPTATADLPIPCADPLAVMRALRGIGARLGGQDARKRGDAPGAPLSAEVMRRLDRHYREHFPVLPDGDATDGRVVATYRAMFILAEAAES